MTYDLAVVGLGGMGSAVLAQTAARGARVIGFEQFQPAHDRGSSHGRARMIRKAYFESPDYVPLLQRAYQLWRELEEETGTSLLRVTGVLSIGQAASEIISGTRRASALHDLALENLSRDEVRSRYPMIELLEEEEAIFEPEAGVLDPEAAVRAHLAHAQKSGAEARFGVRMQSWEATADGFEILLENGERIASRRLVLALGAWFKEALEALGIPIRVTRNVQAWFSPATTAFRAGRFPAFLVDRAGLPAPLYGFPDFGEGIKIAFHGGGASTSADALNREIDPVRDIAPLARAMESWAPGATRTFCEASACMYTLTPDEHFVIDRHPAHPDLILCGGFSGHGFKFAPVIGEIAAELALDGGSRHAIEFLSLRRFRAER